MESPGGTLLPLSNELIAGILDGHGYAFTQDADGDLVGRWDDNLIYFFRLGRSGEILQIRTLASRVFGIDDVLPLYDFCNGWNQDKLWPKAFVHVNDDGTVRVLGEVVADLEHGVTSYQLDQLLACGISSGCQLADSLEGLTW
ncbi:Putative sensory transduction regulator [Asanoa hainanensis]|uniref:Putative sensory transduction regulator n=1 Tax=Asanoa hainanensis TaxID=560556 RepID=A0A239PEK7_9ACTN|nr:YbjN domain-containing protein [Asanoa hainanensis]SNT64839.1 Putative sensory transduction regulator [Asanoa hainanensis]